MKKLFLLTTLLFGLLMVGCSEDNAGTQAGNTAGFGGDNPALSINADYTGGRNVNFSVYYFGNKVTDEAYKVQWDFGDAASGGNNTASTAEAPHAFTETETGEFTVVVNVADAEGVAVGKSTKTVIVKDGGVVGEVDIQVTDTEDPLTKQFTTKAESSSRVPVKLEWDFGGTKMVAPNNTTYTFSKYNKEYTVNLTATDMVSNDSNTAKPQKVTIPANLSIQCTQAEKLVSCTPTLTGVPGGLTDAVYVWDFEQDKTDDNVTTAGNDAAVYTYTDGGQKTVNVSLTSAKIEGELKATTTVNVATNIAMDQIVCNETGNLLEYSCSVNASLINNQEGSTITYKWSSDAEGVKITNETTNNATFTFSKFPSAANPSYSVKVVASNNSDTASQSTRIEIEHPTVTISQAAGTDTIVNLNASLSKVIDGVQYNWVITAPDGTSAGQPTGASVEVNLTQSGTYTAEVTATHSTFANSLKASTTIVNTGVIKNAVINCAPVSTGMEYVCNTDAYAIGENNQAVPLKYQWNITRGDKGETYTFDTKNFTQKFKRYNGTYYVNLVLIAEGSEVAVSAPQKVIVTPNLTLNYTASATAVKQGEKINFTAKLEGELEGVPVENPTYTWYAGSKQQQSGSSNTFTFSSDVTLYYDIKVVVSSPSLGVPLTGVKTVAINPNALKPSDITNLNIDCPQDGNGLDTAKRKCTVTYTNSNSHNGAQIYLVPKGVNGQPDGTPVAFTSGQAKTVVFDWPHLNIANIQNYNDMPTFTAKLGVQLYDAKGKKVADLADRSYTLKYPQVYYEMAHNLDGEYIKEGSRFFGTDAKLTYTKKLYSNLQMNSNVDYFVNFNGKSGTVSKTFKVDSDGQQIDLTSEMRKARFAGTVDGDPFVGENGFGVKISGSGLSKPLYLYGVNTYVGKQNDEKALGKFLNGRSWISPKVEVGFVGGHGKNSITGGFMVPIHIVFADKANLDATGWDHLCVIGVDGTAWHNNNKNDKHRYALPKALILPQANSPFTSNGYSKKGSYYTVLGTQWDHEYGFTEERTTGVTPGQPSIPYNVGGESLKYYPKGTFVEFKYFGFNGVHLGYMTKSGDLGSCVFARYAINNHKDKRFTVNPKEYIPNNKIPNN